MSNERIPSATPPSTAAAFHFGDFTTSAYRTLVRRARDRFAFVRFADAAHEPWALPTHYVLWRHDIDVSPQRALALATIEAEEGVSASYFVLLRSAFYNALEADTVRCLRSIAALGHDVGVHLDASAADVTDDDSLHDAVVRERAIIESITGHAATAFAFHNPGAFELSRHDIEYGGLVNCYAPRFRHAIGYVSDSNGYWRHRRLADVIDDAAETALHVLTHPEWWTDDILSPAARIDRAIAGRAAATRRDYSALLVRSGRRDIRDGARAHTDRHADDR